MPLAFAQILALAKRPAQRPLRLHLLEPATQIVIGLIVIDLVGPAPAGFDLAVTDLAVTDLVGSGPVEIVLLGFALD